MGDRHLVWLFGFFGCWTGAATAPTPTLPIVVRMAEPGEFDPPSAAPIQRTTSKSDYGAIFEAAREMEMPCPLAGPPAPELFEPVAEFARRHLVKLLERSGVPVDGPIQTRQLVSGDDLPAPTGIDVWVWPRAELGQLMVNQWWGDGGSGFRYCLHVQRDARTITIIVKEKSYAIGLSIPKTVREVAVELHAQPRLASDP